MSMLVLSELNECDMAGGAALSGFTSPVQLPRRPCHPLSWSRKASFRPAQRCATLNNAVGHIFRCTSLICIIFKFHSIATHQLVSRQFRAKQTIHEPAEARARYSRLWKICRLEILFLSLFHALYSMVISMKHLKYIVRDYHEIIWINNNRRFKL